MSGDDSSSVKAAGKSSAGILHPVLASLLKDGHKADQKLKEPAAGMVLSLWQSQSSLYSRFAKSWMNNGAALWWLC